MLQSNEGNDSLDFVSGGGANEDDFGDDSLPPQGDEEDAFGMGATDSHHTHPKGGGNMAGMGQMKYGEGSTTCSNFVCQSTHPVAATFHLLFKVS